MRRYPYVGPGELLALLENPTERRQITCADDVRLWLHRKAPQGVFEVIVTFIIDLNGALWIADRHSEHVVCARGGPVFCAGEMTFSVSRSSVEVAAVSNQSTGFCPEPESWPCVSVALEDSGIPHPKGFTASFDFRRCDGCFAINLVKDDWFFCGVCDAELSAIWNFDVENDE